jgi:hypothetical protein
MTHECVSDEAVAADVEKYGLSVMLVSEVINLLVSPAASRRGNMWSRPRNQTSHISQALKTKLDLAITFQNQNG